MPTTLTKIALGQTLITTTAANGDVIHTTGTSATIIDEVWLWSSNTVNDADYTATVQWPTGGQNIPCQVPQNSGAVLLVPGLCMTGTGAAGNVIRVFASAANKIAVTGYVNRITP